MPPITYPNQRTVKIHRESAKSNFLGIKNENWQAASRDLGAHALQLYLYLASNANNYTTALSPVAVRQAIGMARSTYHDQFHKLVEKGYLVPANGNTFDFYEIPQTDTHTQKGLSPDGQNFENHPYTDSTIGPHGQTVLPENIEINNMKNGTNNLINNKEQEKSYKIEPPIVREVTILRPVAKGRDRPLPIEKPIQKEEFTF